MKKIIYIIASILMLAAPSASAQGTAPDGHMMFRGISMGQSMYDFLKAYRAKYGENIMATTIPVPGGIVSTTINHQYLFGRSITVISSPKGWIETITVEREYSDSETDKMYEDIRIAEKLFDSLAARLGCKKSGKIDRNGNNGVIYDDKFGGVISIMVTRSDDEPGKIYAYILFVNGRQ